MSDRLRPDRTCRPSRAVARPSSRLAIERRLGHGRAPSGPLRHRPRRGGSPGRMSRRSVLAARVEGNGTPTSLPDIPGARRGRLSQGRRRLLNARRWRRRDPSLILAALVADTFGVAAPRARREARSRSNPACADRAASPPNLPQGTEPPAEAGAGRRGSRSEEHSHEGRRQVRRPGRASAQRGGKGQRREAGQRGDGGRGGARSRGDGRQRRREVRAAQSGPRRARGARVPVPHDEAPADPGRGAVPRLDRPDDGVPAGDPAEGRSRATRRPSSCGTTTRRARPSRARRT